MLQDYIIIWLGKHGYILFQLMWNNEDQQFEKCICGAIDYHNVIQIRNKLFQWSFISLVFQEIYQYQVLAMTENSLYIRKNQLFDTVNQWNSWTIFP